MSLTMTDVLVEHHTDALERPYVHVTVVIGGEEVTFTIHQSTCYQDTVNVEISGDFTLDPGLRINLNDRLIWDTTREDHPIAESEDREPDIDEGEGAPLSALPELTRKLADREHPHDVGDYSDVQ